MECFSPENDSYRIMLEHFDREIRSRHSFTIEPGWNFFTIPAESLEFAANPLSGKITLFPENNVEKRVIFTWLDLVTYGNVSAAASAPARLAPAAKVKCVAWDLDNTMWKGIVAENSVAQLQPRSEAVELVRLLDERGIIQTVVSKNNFADAWRVIESLRLDDYFLHPAINWQPKSSNLSRIASRLNINIDTFALIDDSPFERAEVQSAFPQLRVYSDDQIKTILSLPEFDVPVTEASRKRRLSYLTEIRREEEREAAGSDYEAFLRSCRMKLRLFVPRDPAQVLRCLELIQRANQLNMSNTRYSADEFEKLLSRPGFLCLALQCEDRFGEYGIVGFASVDETSETATLRDFVLSCRVAQKKVEHAFVDWLALREQAMGKSELRAAIVPTDRNHQILQVFRDLQFLSTDKSEEAAQIVTHSLHDFVSSRGPVTVEAEEACSSPGPRCN
jgi:FkbH-like protein